MASPTFGGSPIFDSIRADNSTFTEGLLLVGDYTKIYQTIHFNREDGNRLISHGFPDRPWTFQGLISADTAARLKTRLSAIESQIDADDYHILVDSYGNTYANAKVMGMHPQRMYGVANMIGVVITGIIQGMAHDGS